MTTINSLAKSKLSKAWAVNNSMSKEPTSTGEATDQVVYILDVKYERQTSKQLLAPTAYTLVLINKRSYWRFSQSLRTYLMGL